MYRDVPGRTYPYFTLFIFTFTPDYSPTCINLFTFAESNILNTHNHEFKKNSQLTTDTQEDILYKHCETTGKAELQAIRQIKNTWKIEQGTRTKRPGMQGTEATQQRNRQVRR